MDRRDDLSVAVIAMSGRFPGARDLDSFWKNLRHGVESVRPLTPEELAASPVDRELRRRPDYVAVASVLDEIELFDADFFRFTAREAELTDPQHRLLMECAWEALEIGGYTALDRPRVGVFASCSTSSYLLNNLYTRDRMLPTALGLQMLVGNDKDYLATHISYKLNLKGPSLGVQTACSSSLVAVHLAAQSLLNHECDAALAGGVTVKVPQNTGYLHQDGLILSPDGRTYAFDSRARGTIFGSGAGIVLLKRLRDALAEGDAILAVIRGSAINNDGSAKVGFTAPSIDGEADVIAEALGVAGIGAETISYVEAHGTGTPLGDPIEIAALTQAYRAQTARTGYCAIGSVKTNIGHLEAAAGIAGFIKAVLCLSRGELPASLNYERPNPEIDFARTPFFVNRELRPWKGDSPRRAGVSSFGFGGTNCHVLLEEAPARAGVAATRAGPFLLHLSARTPTALRALAVRYRDVLENPLGETSLADICYTAGHRRVRFEHSLQLTATSRDALSKGLDRYLSEGSGEPSAPTSAAVPADGRCVALPSYPFERRRYWVEPPRSPVETAGTSVESHPLLQRSLEVAERSAPRLWDSRLDDSRLSFLFDHVVGGRAVFPASAYVEAGLAAGRQVLGAEGVGLEEIELARILPISRETRLQVSATPDGRFRVHARSEDSEWSLHAFGKITASSGPVPEDSRLAPIEERCRTIVNPEQFYRSLQAWGLSYGPAFRCVKEIRKGDREALGRVRLPDGAEAGAYHLHPALWDACFQIFAAAASAEGSQPRTFVPVRLRGLGVLPGSQPTSARVHAVIRSGTIDSEEIECALTVTDDDGRVLAWVDALCARRTEAKDRQLGDARNLLYRLAWEQRPSAPPARALNGSWLIVGGGELAQSLARRLTAAGARCETAPDAHGAAERAARHAWRGLVYFADFHRSPITGCEKSGCDVLNLVHSMVANNSPGELWLVTRGAQWVEDDGRSDAIGNAGLWGLGRVIAFEHSDLSCRRVDLAADPGPEDAADLFAEIASAAHEDQIALRGGSRWVPRLEHGRWEEPALLSLRSDASYLITGGLGALGLQVANWLIDRGARHLVLAGRRAAGAEAARALSARGVDVFVRALDVADESDVKSLLAEIETTGVPVRGIIHAAGVLDDGILREQTPERFSRVMRPKVAGAWNLHLASEHEALDFFVLFSSVTAVFGSPGQANYAAANAAMDAIAHYRRHKGLPATTVNWGPWAEIGMAASVAMTAHRRWTARGLEPLQVRQALEILEFAIGQGREAQVIAVDVRWNTAFAQLGTVPPLLERFRAEAEPPSDAAPSEIGPGVPVGGMLKRTIEDYLRAEAARLLGTSIDRIHRGRPLSDLGLDSLTGIELRSVVGKKFGRALPATLIFDYPTIEALAAFLAGESPSTSGAVPPDADTAQTRQAHLEHVSSLSDAEAEALLLERLEAIEH